MQGFMKLAYIQQGVMKIWHMVYEANKPFFTVYYSRLFFTGYLSVTLMSLRESYTEIVFKLLS